MFKLELVPKWVWLLLGALVLGGVYLGVDSAFKEYQRMATQLAESEAAKNNLLEVNAAINAEMIRLAKDVEDRKKVNDSISKESQDLAVVVDDLGDKLAKAIHDRQLAEAKLGPKSDVSLGGVVFKNIPVEISITWQAYCKAARDKDPACKTSEK